MGTSDFSIPLYNSILLMVGSEDEIDMKRTEMDIYNYLYNKIYLVCQMQIIIAGRTKERLKFSAIDVDIFYHLTNHHGAWSSAYEIMYKWTVDLMEYQEHILGTVYLRFKTYIC